MSRVIDTPILLNVCVPVPPEAEITVALVGRLFTDIVYRFEPLDVTDEMKYVSLFTKFVAAEPVVLYRTIAPT
jgi:hypothetical protein